MKIAGLQKNSTIDFPGKLSTVIFVAGCNYNCYYCHNKHLLDAEEKVLKEEVFAFLEKRKGLIDGVVITGGEPSLSEDLPEFVADIKSMGYDIKLDTNGTMPSMIKSLLDDKLIDFLAVDFKAPFAKYNLIDATEDIEANESAIRSTIETIIGSGVNYEIRTTMIPEITEEDLTIMAGTFPPFMTFALQKYRPVPEDISTDKNRKYYKTEDLNHLSELIKPYQPNTIVRA